MDDAALTKAIGALLGRIPGWAWRPDGTKFAANEVAIFYGPIGTTPDRAIGIRVYGSEDVGEDLQGRRVQLRFRGRKNQRDDADRLAGIAFAVLDGLSRQGGISGIRRFSFGPGGADDNGRDERTDNYRITLETKDSQ